MNMTREVSSLYLTIGSLLFILLLLVSYLSRKRHNTMRGKLYKYMLIAVTLVDATEIIYALLIFLFSKDSSYVNGLLNNLLIRVHWSTGIIWFGLLYYYSVVFIEDINVNSIVEIIKYSFKTKLLFIVTILWTISYIFIPFSPNSSNIPINYYPGIAAIFITFYCTLMVGCVAINLIINRNKSTLRKKLAVWLMIVELLGVFGLQLLFQSIAFLPMGATLQMFFLYYNIENPDLESIEDLEKLKNDIERSNMAKSDFLSNMSHEIRSPMNAIVGFSNSILSNETFDREATISDINNIKSASNNLLEIINNILDISKIESAKETIELRDYSISNVVKELANIIETRIESKPIKLIIDVDQNIPATLNGDSTKLFQVLLNILTNAVKYTEVGRIKLSIVGEKSGNNELLHIKVADTGYGIKKEDFDKMFSKFSRLDDATQNEIEGTGLGLVITKRYVDLMGGRIWFESEYEVGTTFYVDVEQRIVDTNTVGSVTDKNNTTQNTLIDCTGKKALVVDDNKLNLKVASRLLSKYNFEVETLDSAKELIYKIKAEVHYDIIFLDHMMPEMDGIEALHVLRKLDGYVLPPIVALTANAIAGMKEMYLKEGFDEYLSKPINVVELNNLIFKHFGKESNENEKDN